jgi:prolyl oligopeptidase
VTPPLLFTPLAVSALPPAAAPPGLAAEPRPVPETRRVEHVDVLHGTQVPDPYRWLEADVRESPPVAEWVEAQNEVTFGYLEKLPYRERIRKRLTELWDYEKQGTPFLRGGRYYVFKNDGLQNQSVLYTMPTLDADPEVLIDPNTWSTDGTVALAGVSFSDDGRFCAYGVADAGSDWKTWRVLDLATRELLDDELKWLKYDGVAWLPDGSGFYYGRYPEPLPGAEFQSLNLNHAAYFHAIGEKQSQDRLVRERPDEPKWTFRPRVSEDGAYLVVTVSVGTDDRYRILVRDLTDEEGEFNVLVPDFDNEYAFVGNDGPVLYFKTDLDAPRKRLIAIDLRKPQRANWREIVPQAEHVLESVGLVDDRFVCQYLEHARIRVRILERDGSFVRDVAFDGIGSASGFGGRRDHTETFYSFDSFATPPSVYRYDMRTGESELLFRADVKFDPADYEVSQVFYDSQDGTRVPMFLAHRKGLVLDGNNPTLLYGYGGFNISLTPGFSVARLMWMEMGGVFAMPNLRGGGEYGEEWHQGGTKTRKQNVFDDFIAAAEFLIENKYTRPEKLAVQGGSNGGLLVGAVMTQRPDLFAACLPAVGVMDMLRFHHFTAGRFWVDDYGSADDETEFRALLAYSPYHNIREGVQYPATLVTTADTDDRVVPGHSFKFAARLQAAQAGEEPILIRIETRAGHGAGKPTTKAIEEVADLWSFLVDQLDFEPRLPRIGAE